jgi:hypothetical protein
MAVTRSEFTAALTKALNGDRTLFIVAKGTRHQVEKPLSVSDTGVEFFSNDRRLRTFRWDEIEKIEEA